MGVKLFLLIFMNISLVWCGKHDKYAGCSTYNIVLRNREDLYVLYKLEIEANLDVWQLGLPGVREAVVMTTPENNGQFLGEMENAGIQFYKQIDDVVGLLENHEKDVLKYKAAKNKVFPFNDYPTYDQVDQYLERLAKEYPDLVTLVNAGNSFEGKPVKHLKISSTKFTDATKPIYFIDATMHAREWVTTPVALYAIHKLVEDLQDSEKDLLDNIDWIILPIVNPDGYIYTQQDRLWRRTRSYRPELNDTCYGVDANRNFDVNFNTAGVSSDPCSDVYPGPEAFSEPETRYVRNILKDNVDRIQVYLNLHSYGNYVLYGFGNTTLPDNVVKAHQVGAVLGANIDAKKLPKANYYSVGNSNLVLYGSSGSAQDYGQLLVPFSYTLELPGYEYNFLVPPEYIEQITHETWPGIVESARVARLFYRQQLDSETSS